ncbi:MAG: sensor histidine kinase [Bacteroidetes bacterium]|nr:sensor histidine kinase [Bacteroidota bacterium]
MGRFYVATKEFEKAASYLSSALQTGYMAPSLSRKRDIELLLFKVDSAGGRYISAIRHMDQFRAFTDSIYDEARIRQANELRVKYETERQEADIRNLRSTSNLQASELRQAGRLRTITYALLIALLILAVTIYSRYRLKKRHNQELENRQKIIVGQYEEVCELMLEQRKLIKEKEWLVKEIHHRVKNNLQIVISLLNAQAQYADNTASVDALLESRERMHTIAIIHQMLYQQEEGTSIQMQDYINNMIGSLQQCLTNAGRTHFHCDIASIALDISQTVPLGLIINEAVTNSVKYAFKDGQAGVVSISLKHADDNHLLLTIADNGRGLPSDFDISASKTLGIQLIKIFSDQLEGKLSFVNQNGLQLRLLFKEENPL